MFSRNRGHGGAYDYFVCRGRQLRTCSQRYRPVELIEEAVVRYYATVQLTPARRERIRQVIHDQFDGLIDVAEREIARTSLELSRLDDEERKLLDRHYADRVSDHIYDQEYDRIRRERAHAHKTLDDLSVSYDKAKNTLDLALELTSDVQAAYRAAAPDARRFFNQAFFERIDILEDDVADATLAQPYKLLLDQDFIDALADWQSKEADSASAEKAAEPVLAGTGARTDRTPGLSWAEGSIRTKMVELAGLEPATSWVRCRGLEYAV
jgi:hypothetical protein